MQTILIFLIAPFFVVGIIYGYIELSFNGGRIWTEMMFEDILGEAAVVEDEESE